MRVVMRREQTHSLLLNFKLGPKLVTIAKHSDTAIRIACATTPTTSSTFLLRIKTRDDRDDLLKYLERPCDTKEQNKKTQEEGKKSTAAEEAVV